MTGLGATDLSRELDPALLDVDTVLAAARRRTGLTDFGDDWFLEPMGQFLKSAAAQGGLTAQGAEVQFETAVNSVVNRLRMQDDLRRHSEIRNEHVDVGGIILGLPRTGSTILQKLLSSAPGMTTIRWFEGANYAMFPGERRGDAMARRAAAQTIIDGWLAISPEMASQHPMFPDAPAEEIMILGQLFVSTLMEGTVHVPDFAKWLDDYDQSRGHEDLRTILQYLQWQDPAHHRGKRWILKSPSNLPYAALAARTFPDAVLIMTHRDPLETVPSCVSMMSSLYHLSSSIDEQSTAQFWFPRLVTWLERFEHARQAIPDRRIVDVHYADFMRDPVREALPVLERMGIAIDPDMQAMLTDFMEANRRDKRPSHDYSLDRFGLRRDAVEQAFADYRGRYIVRS